MEMVTDTMKENDTEWLFMMSNVAIPYTIAQHITNLTSDWMVALHAR
jgi:hypothetical protein